MYASHPNYNGAQDQMLSMFHENMKGKYTQEQAKKFLDALSKKLDDAIEAYCVQGGKKVDELFKYRKYQKDGVLEIRKFFKEVMLLYKIS